LPHAGDVVMIKSSLGIGFSRIVKALLDKYPRAVVMTAALKINRRAPEGD
jgi:hypothetical protein